MSTRIARTAILFAWLVLAAVPVSARGFSLIRDAEIERTMTRVATPILRAAGLQPSRVDIYLVDDRDLNAFVAGGDNIFLYTGLVSRLDNIDQLRWVIAHETGHIAGGHATRRDMALRGARGTAALGMIGAAAATLAGSPEAGLAIASSTSQVAERRALAHNRAEEASADQAGLRYMASAGGDPQAILDVLRLFRGQELLRSARMDPYAQTHPLWGERIALLEQRAESMPPVATPDPTDAYWYGRMVAKLDGFLQSPKRVLRDYADDTEPAILARAVAWHRLSNLDRALAHVDGLLSARPEDPYYHELRGQFLIEAGRADAAVSSYRDAVALAPNEALILGGLGRALLNTDAAGSTQGARDALARSADLDKANAGVLRDLALAEARLGNEGAAALATAERFALMGQFEDANRHAQRAAALLPEGSPGWRQAQDVITVSRRALN